MDCSCCIIICSRGVYHKLASSTKLPMFLINIVFGFCLLLLPTRLLLVNGLEIVKSHPRDRIWHEKTDHHDQIFIVNKDIAPDGFQRSWALFFFSLHRLLSFNRFAILLSCDRTVLAGRTPQDASFPGPLITGRKVNSAHEQQVEVPIIPNQCLGR